LNGGIRRKGRLRGTRRLLGYSALVILLLTLSSIVGIPRSDHQVAAATVVNPLLTYSGVAGEVTFTVVGAKYEGLAYPTGYDEFDFVVTQDAMVQITASAPGNPYGQDAPAVSSRLSLDDIPSSSPALGNGPLTTSGSFPASIGESGTGEIIENLYYTCAINCPPDTIKDVRVVLTFTLVPTLTLQSDASGSVDIPGTVTFSGSASPTGLYINFYVFKDNVIQPVNGYNYYPIETDSSGNFQYTLTFSTQDQAGSYEFIANVTSLSEKDVPVPDVTAQATLSLTIGSPTTTEGQRLPIILIPGVAGSELGFDVGSQYYDLWPGIPGLTPVGDPSTLALSSSGEIVADPAAPTVVTGGITDAWPVNYYGGMEDALVKDGYVLGTTLFKFPYDWRLDNADHYLQLDALVQTALEKSGAPKVILLAHSMGGLIARGYLLSCPQCQFRNRVDTVITMGTPYWGSPKPFYALTMGYSFGNPFFGLQTMKSLAQNFPSAYELLPSVPFVFGSGGTVSLDDTFGIQYSSVVRTSSGTYASGDDTQWTLNENLLTTAEDFTANFGTPSAPTPYPNGVKFYAIIGQGVSTVNGYWERPATPKEIEDNQYVVLNDKDVVLVPLYGDGDGTVPLWSLAINTATQLYVPDTGNGDSAHGALPNNPTVQQIVVGIANGNVVTAAGFPRHDERSLTTIPEYDGLTATFGDRIDFVVHSSALLTVEDTATGQKLGYTSPTTVVENVTSGSFEDLNGVQYASASSGSTYKAMINGTATGSFQLMVNITSADRFMSFVYPEEATVNGSLSTLTIDPQAVLAAGNSSSSLPTLVSTGGNATSLSPTIVQFQSASGAASGSASPPSGASVAIGLVFIAAIVLIPVFLVALFIRRRRGKKG